VIEGVTNKSQWADFYTVYHKNGTENTKQCQQVTRNRESEKQQATVLISTFFKMLVVPVHICYNSFYGDERNITGNTVTVAYHKRIVKDNAFSTPSLNEVLV
jgi:hypothetical protein